MTINKKQIKITKLFRRGQRLPEDYNEIQEEINQLEKTLKEKQDALFQLQRNSYKRKLSPTRTKPAAEAFIRPQKIVLNNSVETLKRQLELNCMVTGMEVQSYVADDHCCIVYHMQHDSEHQVKHGLRIDMKSGTKVISKSSLPLGFNLKAVLEDFDTIMTPDCLDAIQKALIAYYNRLQQYEELKRLLNIQAQLFKVIDGSHIEISFYAKSEMEEDDEQVNVVLMLDYRVYDIRPKTITFKEKDLPEGTADALKEQCVVFKRKTLQKAFEEAFIDTTGPYKITQQIGVKPTTSRRRKRPRPPPNYHYNNDDTFRPEDCSEGSEEDYVE